MFAYLTDKLPNLSPYLIEFEHFVIYLWILCVLFSAYSHFSVCVCLCACVCVCDFFFFISLVLYDIFANVFPRFLLFLPFCFGIGSHCVSGAVFEPVMLPQLPKCWDYGILDLSYCAGIFSLVFLFYLLIPLGRFCPAFFFLMYDFLIFQFISFIRVQILCLIRNAFPTLRWWGILCVFTGIFTLVKLGSLWDWSC